MKRTAIAIGAIVLGLVIAGYVSNILTRHTVEERVQNQNLVSIEQTARLWHLSLTSPASLHDESILIRIERTPENKRVKLTVPPSAPLPFAYAQARQAAPFLFRVYYGWAVGGKNLSFGEGGEKLVLSVFGSVKSLRTTPHWYF